MKLDAQQIEMLLNQRSITYEWPWNTSDELVIDKHWKDVLAEICRKLHLQHKSEFGHYGSGYSSYVDSWLYREDESFRFNVGNCFWGLVILYSRLSKYCVIGQGQKVWNEKNGSSYLPSFDFVDHFTLPLIADLADKVECILANRGIQRLRKEQVSEVLGRNIRVPTILEEPPLHHFDAIFYWED